MNYEDLLEFMTKYEYRLGRYNIIVNTVLFSFRISNRNMFEIYDNCIYIHGKDTMEIHTDEITSLTLEVKK